MDLSPGERISSYQILNVLGAGGMGQVYRAQDLRLKRMVALKVVPRAVAGDPERIKRFTREAESVAALSHPNIVTLYSIEEADGVPFLTMELVEGRPLSDRIGPGGLPVEDAIAFALEICDGVAAAHSKGIIHRDLKPGNVMVTPAARVKILDFGLSKQLVAGSEESTTHLGGEPITTAGTFLGTVAYMSPEQAHGRPADHRSDVFSFGVMLYEMLAGKRPFTGESDVAILSAILSKTPGSLREQRRAIPAALEQIVHRCLRKDPSERYQSFADIRADLASLQQDVVAAHGSSVRTRRAVVAGAVLAVIVGGVAAAVVFTPRGPTTPAAAPGPAINRISLLTRDGNAGMAAVSPDGRYIAHVVDAAGRPSLWVRQTQTQSAVQIVPPADVVYQGVNYSPDGNYIFYATHDQKGEWRRLHRVPALGGHPEPILHDIDTGAAPSATTKRLAFIRYVITKDAPRLSQLVTVASDGTDEQIVATLKAPQSFGRVTPAWSGDGQRLLLLASNPPNVGQLAIVSASDGKVEWIPGEWGGIAGLAWTSTGDNAFISARLSQYEVNRGIRSFIVSGPARLWRVSIPAGTREELTRDFTMYEGVSLTADDRTLITTRREISSRVAVLQGGDVKDVTSGEFDEGRVGLDWIDERQVLFASNRSGTNETWRAAIDGTGLEKHPLGLDVWWPVATADRRYWFFYRNASLWRATIDGRDTVKMAPDMDQWTPPVFSADGQSVYLRTTQGIFTLPVTGGSPQRVTGPGVWDADVLPDGRVLGFATVAASDGRADVRQSVILLTPASGKVTVLDGIPVPAGYNPNARSPLRLTPDRLAISYVDTEGGRAAIWSYNLADGSKRRITRLTTPTVFWFAWSPGGRLAIAHGGLKRDVVRVTLRDE